MLKSLMKTIIDLCNKSKNAKDMALWNTNGALHIINAHADLSIFLFDRNHGWYLINDFHRFDKTCLKQSCQINLHNQLHPWIHLSLKLPNGLRVWEQWNGVLHNLWRHAIEISHQCMTMQTNQWIQVSNPCIVVLLCPSTNYQSWSSLALH